MKKSIAKVITGSTLWNVGKDGHNALGELVESLKKEIKVKRLSQTKLMNWLLQWDNEEITTSRLLQLINEYFKEEVK